ncbi:MAG: NADAR family protein [Gemmatimonadota bacterium]|nr:NADAR family protein [Gemmatimonadota bacterium]
MVSAFVDFFSETDPFFEFSSYFPVQMEIEGDTWPTVEHYFQAQKFPGPENAAYRERIRNAPDPHAAKALGRTREIAIRPDWEEVKEEVMFRAVRHKFRDPVLRRLLLETGDRVLREASPQDEYWGIGPHGTGANRLGVLLMRLRDELRVGGWPARV